MSFDINDQYFILLDNSNNTGYINSTNEYNSLEDNVKWNKMQMDKAEKDCYDINMKFKLAIAEYTKAEVISIREGSTIKDKNETEAANTRMYAIKQKAREICESYGSLKDKYMKSVNELNSLKVKISDMNEKYKTANASIGGGGGSDSGGDGGSFLSPIINISTSLIQPSIRTIVHHTSKEIYLLKIGARTLRKENITQEKALEVSLKINLS